MSALARSKLLACWLPRACVAKRHRLSTKRGRSDLGSRSGALDKGNRPGQSTRGAACRRCPGRLPCGRSRRWRRKDGRPIAALVPWLLAFSLSGRGFKRGSEGEGGARGRRATDPPTLRHKCSCGTSSAQVRSKCGASAEQVRSKCGTSAENSADTAPWCQLGGQPPRAGRQATWQAGPPTKSPTQLTRARGGLCLEGATTKTP